MKSGRKTKVLAVASAGGHWVQLCRLHSLLADYDVAFVTTFKGTRAPVANAPVIVVKDASRQEKLGLIVLAAHLAFILLRRRPDVIISTGAAPGYLALRLGKLFGCRTIWLDSIANVEELSLSGKLAGGCTDLWLTQWEHLAGTSDGLRYMGSVL